MTTSQKNYPRSMSVSDMMKLGKLADGKESTVINVYKFDITSVTLSVVLECHSGHESTRRPRGAPFPRAMRGWMSFLRVPHPPECVYPTRRPRGAIPRVYCPVRNPRSTRVLSRPNKNTRMT